MYESNSTKKVDLIGFFNSRQKIGSGICTYKKFFVDIVVLKRIIARYFIYDKKIIGCLVPPREKCTGGPSNPRGSRTMKYTVVMFLLHNSHQSEKTQG